MTELTRIAGARWHPVRHGQLVLAGRPRSVVGVEQWAEIRRMHFVAGVSIKEIARRTGRDRNTVRAALRSDTPPRYERRPVPSKLDPFKAEIHRLLREDPRLPGVRVRELIEPLGYAGGKTEVVP
jgi:transposase